MIPIQNLLWSLAEYGKDYVSGNDPIPEFNSKANEAQRMFFDMLSPEYDKNERVRVLLEPFTRLIPTAADANGIIPFPSDFHRALGGKYNQGGKRYPIYYAKENEIIDSDFIPQRKADLSQGKAYITYVNGTMRLNPASALNLDLSYLASPSEVKLVYDYNVTPASYMQLNTTDTVNFEWNNDAYNMILSILLLKYSLITRDDLKAQLATYGINSDLIHSV